MDRNANATEGNDTTASSPEELDFISMARDAIHALESYDVAKASATQPTDLPEKPGLPPAVKEFSGLRPEHATLLLQAGGIDFDIVPERRAKSKDPKPVRLESAADHNANSTRGTPRSRRAAPIVENGRRPRTRNMSTGSDYDHIVATRSNDNESELPPKHTGSMIAKASCVRNPCCDSSGVPTSSGSLAINYQHQGGQSMAGFQPAQACECHLESALLPTAVSGDRPSSSPMMRHAKPMATANKSKTAPLAANEQTSASRKGSLETKAVYAIQKPTHSDSEEDIKNAEAQSQNKPTRLKIGRDDLTIYMKKW